VSARRLLLSCGSGALSLLLVTTNGIAQAPTPSPSPEQSTETTEERVIVTAPYLPSAEVAPALPLKVVPVEALQKQGANTPIEGLRQLPSVIGNAESENAALQGFSAYGHATISLRGIGGQNALVLINGRRAFSGIGASAGFANINAIPIAALARVEILETGASALYGSEAVAGVVNFILLSAPGEKPFEGVEVSTLYGNTTDKDAHVLQNYVRAGVASDRFAIAVAAEYYSRAALYSRDRDIAATTDLRSLGGFSFNSTTFPGRVTVNRFPQVLLDFSDNAPLGLQAYRVFNGPDDPQSFNTARYTTSIAAQDEYMVYATAMYKLLGDALQAYGEFSYSLATQDNRIAPAPFTIPRGGYRNPALGIFNGTDANGNPDGSIDNSIARQREILRSSPYNPFGGTSLTSLSYRLVQELGNRRVFFDEDSYRYVVGLRGELALKDNPLFAGFAYDTGFVYETWDLSDTDTGDARRGDIYRAILSGQFNPFIGLNAPLVGTVPTYSNGVATGQRQTYDNKTAAQNAAYTGRTPIWQGSYLYDAKIKIKLGPSLYQGGITCDFGYEHRRVASENLDPDPTQLSGEALSIFTPSKYKYRQTVNSVFAQATVPVVTPAMQVRGIHNLELFAAARYESFDDSDELSGTRATFNNDGSPQLAIRYQPVSDLMLRVSWGKGFRSPGPENLFAPSQLVFFTLFDPLTQQSVTPEDGVILAGNVNLQPEDTDAYSAGFVWTPKIIPGLSVTTDFYQLFSRDIIGGSDPQLILTLNGRSGGRVFSNLVTRDPDTNIPTQINAPIMNRSKRLVEGVDVNAVYQIPSERFGKFTISGGYNHFFIWKAETAAGLGSVSFLGSYNASLPLAPGAIPWNKGFVRGEWAWNGIDFVATCNYVGDYNDDPGYISGNTVIGGTDENPDYLLHRRLPSYVTLDMQLSYEWKQNAAAAPTGTRWRQMLQGTKVTVGVNNAFDRNPPTLLGAFSDNYDTSLYSIRNRYYYIGFNKRF
jgi:iron complex outermembrane recepter protein